MLNSRVDNSVILGTGLIGAAALTYYMTRPNKPIDELYDFENQSIEIDAKEHIRVCSYMKGKPLIEYRFPDVRTLNEVLSKGLELSADGPCLGEREGPGKGPYTWIKYSEVIEKVNYIASGIINKGIESNNETNIGIYSSNRSEWVISEYACYSQSFPIVSLYDSYGKDSIRYILEHAEIKVIFVDSFKRLMNILEVVDKLPNLKLIVHYNDIYANEYEQIAEYQDKVEIVSFKELLEVGKANIQKSNPPKPSDIATVCYTSGTTGNPKGALITHLNMISNEAAISERVNKPHLNFGFESPVHLCYLPLAHMLERECCVTMFLAGGQIGFLSGDITNLSDDSQELRPSDFPIVPRLMNKLYKSVQTQLEGSPLKKILFKMAIASKESDMKKGIYRKDTIYDRLIFNKIREKLGGNLKRMATGSAPISNEIMMFSRAVFSCPIPEAYGQTEATCAITFCHPFDPNLGHCGPPVNSYMVKLVDVPEMDYFSDKNQGEICCKGPSRFKGYLKDEAKTAETIDEDGWLHTGDIGMWLPNGTLKIIDRKKNLFKLSQGEYISPEKVENIYLKSSFIAQILIEGDPLKDHVVGVVVPEADYLLNHCKTLNINGSFEELCQKKDIKQMIIDDLVEIGKKAGLMSYEQVKNIYLHSELMTAENGLATPTMKIKRVEVRKHFKSVITSLYDEIKN